MSRRELHARRGQRPRTRAAAPTTWSERLRPTATQALHGALVLAGWGTVGCWPIDAGGVIGWLGKLYCGGVALAVAWLAVGAARVAGVVARARPAPAAIRAALAAVAGDAATRVRTLVSDECGSAAAVGGFRPAILLPAGQVVDGPGPASASLRAVLGHEWSHIRHGDLHRMAFSRALWVPLYAHPLYWWLRRAQRRDQELLADRAAVAASGLEAADYAALLLQWAKTRPARFAWAVEMLGMGNRSSHLSRRIAVLLAEQTTCREVSTPSSHSPQLGIVAAIVAAAALSLLPLSPSPNVGTAGETRRSLASAPPAAPADKRAAKPASDGTNTTKTEIASRNANDRRNDNRRAARHGAAGEPTPAIDAVAVFAGTTGATASAQSSRVQEDCKPDHVLPGESRRKAIAQAVGWLVRHQSADGGWRFAHGASCPVKLPGGQGACSGDGNATAGTASTGMALLALMAAGHRPGVEGPHRAALDKGVDWLVRQQAGDGQLYAGNGMSGTLYSQGIATLALCEAYHGSRAERLKQPAQRGLDFIARAQDKNGGGWRYAPGMPGDTSVLGWQVLALRSGQQAGLAVAEPTLDGARKFLQSVAGGPNRELYAYVPNGAGANNASTLNAVGALSKQLLGAKPDDQAVIAGLKLLAATKPDLGAQRDSYRWFFTSQAIARSTDTAARLAWQTELATLLVRSQEREGCAAGSWDAANPQPDKWSQIGGRLMATAMSTISLAAEERQLAILIASRTTLD